MSEIHAPIAGEMSGHIFIADDFYGFDDALYVAIRVISQMVWSGQSVTDFVDKLPAQHATPEMHIACSAPEKFQLIESQAANVNTSYDNRALTLTVAGAVRTRYCW